MTRRVALVLAAFGFTLITAFGTEAADRDVASVDQTGQASENGTTADREKYTKCMKDNGATLPSFDSGDGENGSVRITPQAEPQRRKNQEAHERCEQFSSGRGRPEAASQEQLAQQSALARCLRGQGVEVPDPEPEDGGALTLPGNAQEDPHIGHALDECDEQVRRRARAPGTGR